MTAASGPGREQPGDCRLGFRADRAGPAELTALTPPRWPSGLAPSCPGQAGTTPTSPMPRACTGGPVDAVSTEPLMAPTDTPMAPPAACGAGDRSTRWAARTP